MVIHNRNPETRPTAAEALPLNEPASEAFAEKAASGRLRRDGNADRLFVDRVWKGPGAEIVQTRWSRRTHPHAFEGKTPYAAMEFMRRGTFRMRSRHATIVGDPNTAVLFNPGEPFAVSHPHGEGNLGITIRLRGVWLEQLLVDGRRGSRAPFAAPQAIVEPSVKIRLRELMADIARGDDLDTLAVEERTLEVVSAVLGGVTDDGGRRDAADSKDDRAARRVAEIMDYLSGHYARKVTLDDIARAVGCSSWHAAKLFRRVTGQTIYQYLVRLRLSYVLDAVSEGCRDLTHLAMRTGFSSHSHLAASFRAEFGRPPSAVRKRCRVQSTPRR